MTSTGPDVAIPLAFPDYLISVPKLPVPDIPGIDIPGIPSEVRNPRLKIPKGPQQITIPDLPGIDIPGIPRTITITIPDSIPVPDLPGFDIPYVPPSIPIPDDTSKVPLLGHAGILFFNGLTGLTKYYEYGRYDPAQKGVVRRQIIPDVVLSQGKPTRTSLTSVIEAVSRKAGQSGRILAAYIRLPTGAFQHILAYCMNRERDNTNSKRKPYDLFSNSCCTFMHDAAIAGAAAMPPVSPPNPAMYMEKVRSWQPPLNYVPKPPIVFAPVLGF